MYNLGWLGRYNITDLSESMWTNTLKERFTDAENKTCNFVHRLWTHLLFIGFSMLPMLIYLTHAFSSILIQKNFKKTKMINSDLIYFIYTAHSLIHPINENIKIEQFAMCYWSLSPSWHQKYRIYVLFIEQRINSDYIYAPPQPGKWGKFSWLTDNICALPLHPLWCTSVNMGQ